MHLRVLKVASLPLSNLPFYRDSDADLGFRLPPPKAVPPAPSAPASTTSGPIVQSPPSSTPSLKPSHKPTATRSVVKEGSNKTGQGGEEERFAVPTAPAPKPKKKKTDNVEQNYLSEN